MPQGCHAGARTRAHAKPADDLWEGACNAQRTIVAWRLGTECAAKSAPLNMSVLRHSAELNGAPLTTSFDRMRIVLTRRETIDA